MAPTIITTTVVPAKSYFQGGAAYDLIDLTSVKKDFGITDGESDDFLKRAITRVSRGVRTYCNRTFQAQTYQDQFWAHRDPYPWQLLSDVMPLQLARWPIIGSPCLAGTNAPNAPALSSVAGGALTAARYYVRITYLTASGETAVSAEANQLVASSSLLQVASPGYDPLNLATGWNVYVGTAPGAETLQNTSPLAIASAWTLPTTGLLIGGTAMQSFVSVIETTGPTVPGNLIEGVDFIVDYDQGQLTRLSISNGYPRHWPQLPLVVFYQAGFSPLPDDLQNAAVYLIKEAYFARTRDPKLRNEDVSGIYSAQYWFGSGPGGRGAYPPDIQAALDFYRPPVVG